MGHQSPQRLDRRPHLSRPEVDHPLIVQNEKFDFSEKVELLVAQKEALTLASQGLFLYVAHLTGIGLYWRALCRPVGRSLPLSANQSDQLIRFIHKVDGQLLHRRQRIPA